MPVTMILIHLPLNKMAAISQMTFSNAFLTPNKKFSLSKFVLMGQVNNITALVQIMAWHLFSAKPLNLNQ